jgi:transmembrane sensor
MAMPEAHGGPAGSPSLPRAALEEAAHWHSVMDGRPSPEEAREFEQWRAASPDHERAWQRMRELWSLLSVPAAQAPPDRLGGLVRDTAARRRKRRRTAASGLALGAALLASAWWAGQTQLPWLAADLRSGVGERRTVELSDGSRVTLNTDSAIDVVYTATERRIVLRQGEILAEVAHGAAGRPFVVDTRDGTATALGTRYLVRLLPEATRVTVTESRVRACPAQAGAACRDAAAGQTLEIRPASVESVQPADRDAEAWTQGRYAVIDTPLPQVLAELARYRRGLLLYDAQALADLRVSAVLPLQGDEAYAALQESLPIRVRSYGPWILRIERR